MSKKTSLQVKYLTVSAMLSALGGDCTAEEDTLTVRRARLTGGSVSSAGDHRIAMAAAIAATAASGAVTVEGAEAVNKSYPHFFDDMKKITVKGEIVCCFPASRSCIISCRQ